MLTACCPACKTPTHFAADREGTEATCEKCGHTFFLKSAPVEPPVSVQPPTMLTGRCPECRYRVHFAENMQGYEHTCERCSHAFFLFVAPKAAPPPLPKRDPSGRRPARPHRRPPEEPKTWVDHVFSERNVRWGGIAFGAICAFYFCWAVLVNTGLHTPTHMVEKTVRDGLNQQLTTQVRDVHLFHDRGSHYTGYAETDHGLLSLDVHADGRQVYWRVSP
jgi:hypothetical protein